MLFDFTRGWNVREECFWNTATLLFLIQNRLAKLNAFAANVDVAWSFDQWPYIAKAFATEGTCGVFLLTTATTTGTIARTASGRAGTASLA
jgi:hypothetical protein